MHEKPQLPASGSESDAVPSVVEGRSVATGSVSGATIVTGDANAVYELRVDNVHGNIVVPVAPPKPCRRPVPVDLRPRPMPDHLDREAEVAAALTDPLGVTSIEGPGGIGKTSLLRHIAHQVPPASFADGIVYALVDKWSAEDILNLMFTVFWDCETNYRPAAGSLRAALHDLRAFILLDNCELVREDFEHIENCLPGCGLIFSSARGERDDRAIVLSGFATPHALKLLEHSLGRQLTDDEGPAAKAVCDLLSGSPLAIVRAAAVIREDNVPLGDLAAELAGSDPANVVTRRSLGGLSVEERRVLAALVVHGDVPVHAEHLAAICGIEEVARPLDGLERRGLVRHHSPRYSVTGGLADELAEAMRLSDVSSHAFAHWLRWAAATQHDPAAQVRELDSVLPLLRHGARNGPWAETMALCRMVEGAFALSGRWSAWAEVLDTMLDTASRANDPGGQAFALHQQGSRALCRGDREAASSALSRALTLREALNDQRGADATRHNLEMAQRRRRGWHRRLRVEFAALVGLLVLIAIGIGAWRAVETSSGDSSSDGSGGGGPTVSVPHVLGDRCTTAKAQLEAHDLKGTCVRRPSSPANMDVVISTDPPVGASARRNSTVRIFIGAGPSKVSVPDVAGKAAADARQQLHGDGFDVIQTQIDVNSPKFGAGIVVGTLPAARSFVTRGAKIELRVATGNVAVPDVEGLTCPQATATLKNQTLVATCKPVSSAATAGIAVGSSPAVGVIVTQGSPVDVSIASAPTQTTVPPVVGLSKTDAVKTLVDADLKAVIQQAVECVDSSKDKTVKSQNPAPGAKADPGSSVTIVVLKFRPSDPSCVSPPPT